MDKVALPMDEPLIMTSSCHIKNSKRWCCVPQCIFKRGRSLHHFPKDTSLKAKWIEACKMPKLTPNMVVCGDHFNDEDFIKSHQFSPKRRLLKKGAVPAINLPVSSSIEMFKSRQLRKKSRRIPKFPEQNTIEKKDVLSRYLRIREEKEDPLDGSFLEELSQASSKIQSYKQLNCSIHNLEKESDNSNDTTAANVLLEEIESDSSAEMSAAKIFLDLSNQKQSKKNDKTSKEISIDEELPKNNVESLNFMRLLKSDEQLKNFTGINFHLLQNIANAVKINEKGLNPFTISIESQIVLCLCKLRLNLSFKCLSILFCIDQHTCSFIFLKTLHVLSFILKDAIFWPCKDEILRSMPVRFIKNFKNTFVVLHCAEVLVEESSCPSCQLRLYSYQKSCATIKFLVGFSPSGLVISVSEPFIGLASNETVFVQSNIVKKLVPNRDAIMVDKYFSIEKECADACVDLIMPPKLGKNNQLSPDDAQKTLDLAVSRAGVELGIQKLKAFKILHQKMSTAMIPYVDEVFKIICGIINLTEPVLLDKKF